MRSQYTQPGFNGNILGVLRYGVSDTAMPNATLANADPGAGSATLADLDVTQLVPADAMTAPNSTMYVTVTRASGVAAIY